jgi:hypothetical protein
MPNDLRSKVITATTLGGGGGGFSRVSFAYVVICGLALAFDLFTDRSFGAVMLSVLPVALLALGCLLVSPWLGAEQRRSGLRAWFIGALLILTITIGFSLLGVDQAKTGEAVFIYASMVMALPGSLVLPIVAFAVEPLFGSSATMRIMIAWVVCVGMGWFEWKALAWSSAAIRRRTQRPN